MNEQQQQDAILSMITLLEDMIYLTEQDECDECCNEPHDEPQEDSEPMEAPIHSLTTVELIEQIIIVNLQTILDGHANRAFAPDELLKLQLLKSHIVNE